MLDLQGLFRSGLLTLATGEFLPKGRVGDIAHIFAGAIGAMVSTILAMGAVALVKSDRLAGDMLTPQIALWVADLALPIGFALIAVRLAWKASPSTRTTTWSGSKPPRGLSPTT